MKHRTVAIIQARMGSKRFPGKMLAKLGSRSLLEWVIRRVSESLELDDIFLATSTKECDDALVELSEILGIKVARGSEEDVMERFIIAAIASNATNIVRICADNPFVDPLEIDRLIKYFQVSSCDYACNHQDRLGSEYADGFGGEIFSFQLLKDISQKTLELRYREHVTLYLWEHIKDFNLEAIKAPVELRFPSLRFDVDIPSDLSRLCRLVDAGVLINSTARQIVKVALEVEKKMNS